eukprot:CAMPEP_0115135550 /NCGR_PEP_ID=MMETSP0227-20121206/55800_1 /TAXON_ID=89957 /ORGANISM="Polarella glacialis, Strain CCMP 1383" /LENGTH=193 /DNA_ID=CAMNT_0002542325 /DNA_START=73 /DNA_END=651 /DNA_ORIENTATION=-
MASGAGHFLRCLGAVLRKNFTLKSRHWVTSLLELLLPVALMGLLIWIRSEVTKTDVPARSYVEAPENNPTWFAAEALNASAMPFLSPERQQLIETLCGSFEERKEHYTGSGLDALILVAMASSGQKMAIVGADSKGFFDFVSSLPGYADAVLFFSTEAKYESYLDSPNYGFHADAPPLFAAIVVRSAASCGAA